MRLVRQKENGCGPACVAMLAGVTLEEAERAVGKTRKTPTRDVAAGLTKLRLRPGPKLVRLRPGEVPPEDVVVKIRWHQSKVTHWVVHERNGRVFDPCRTEVTTLEETRHRAVVLSYLPMVRTSPHATVRRLERLLGSRAPIAGFGFP